MEERGGQSYPPLITTKTKNSWTKDGNDGTTKNGLPLIPPYSTTNIIEAALSVIIAPARLLVYNAASDEVVVCSMAPHMVALDIGEYFNTCNRCRFILPILVPELFRQKRLKPHRGNVQALWSDADFPYVNDTNSHPSEDANDEKEESNRQETRLWAPWIQFGSVLRKRSYLPSVHAYPNPNYLGCLEDVSRSTFSASDPNASCSTWSLPFGNGNNSWDDLIPRVVWRGSDYDFLPSCKSRRYFQGNYSVPSVPFWPRRYVVHNISAMVMEEEEGWINASFEDRMSLEQLAAFRYQLDLGGAGGTTWEGTLEKLAMPGVLLHHETPAMDWFYDQIHPYEHYIPVRTDLADLYQQYKWAESHQDQAKAIAQRGTAFARRFLSNAELPLQHQHYFGQNNSILQRIVDSYAEEDGLDIQSMDSLERVYYQHGITLFPVAVCNRRMCDVKVSSKKFRRISINDKTCFSKLPIREFFGGNMNKCKPA